MEKKANSADVKEMRNRQSASVDVRAKANFNKDVEMQS